jgi:hypothetical protein
MEDQGDAVAQTEGGTTAAPTAIPAAASTQSGTSGGTNSNTTATASTTNSRDDDLEDLTKELDEDGVPSWVDVDLSSIFRCWLAWKVKGRICVNKIALGVRQVPRAALKL